MVQYFITELDVYALSREVNRVIYYCNFYLGNTATVFQAEVTAIRKSAEMLLGSGHDNRTSPSTQTVKLA